MGGGAGAGCVGWTCCATASGDFAVGITIGVFVTPTVGDGFDVAVSVGDIAVIVGSNAVGVSGAGDAMGVSVGGIAVGSAGCSVGAGAVGSGAAVSAGSGVELALGGSVAWPVGVTTLG